MPKQTKKVIVETGIQYKLEGSLRTVAGYINDMIEKHGEEAVIDIDIEHGYGDSYYVDATLIVSRLETDEEQAVRERNEEAARVRVDAAERALLERLRAKYGS